MKKLFISYAQDDFANINIQGMIDILVENGYEILWDKAILEYGDHQIETIKKAIEKSDYVLSILSPQSIKRPWVKRELYEAILQEFLRKKKVLLPFLVGGLSHKDPIIKKELFHAWTKSDPFFIVHNPEYEKYEDLIEALQKIQRKNSPFSKNINYSVLPFHEEDLDIYRTSELVKWGKNEHLKYVRTIDSYFLFGFNKGMEFKHFVITNKEDSRLISDMISSYEFCCVSGGEPYPPNQRLTWFLDQRYEITSTLYDPYCNNIEPI